ncbi:hypothetical protein [Marinagarivorans algicola]|uniref:hypothetical protein n=1 Tax=Marinagarivorans algicola TaxID=1513270 RepID=UPI0037362983
MDMKILIGLFFIVLSLLALTACKTAEIVFYEHKPSKGFYESFDYGKNNLNDFKKGGVLFVVDVKEINRSDYVVWLGLYSQSSGKNIGIEKAEITGNGWKEAVLIGQDLKLDVSVPDKGLMKKSAKLFQVQGELFQKVMNDGGSLTLTVTYVQDGVSKIIEFNLERRVEKHTVFST